LHAALALEALKRMPFTLSASARAGVGRAEWPARLQRLGKGPLLDLLPPSTALFLDGGHNESAGQALADWVASGPKPVDLIVGMRANKALAAFLAPLAPQLRRLVAVPIAGDKLSTPTARIVDAARFAGIRDAVASDSVAAAVAALAGDPPARLLICGSLYLAGSVLAENS
jgi:dihydrofolate synthase/folylpolyglutamate synthase